MSLGAPPPGTVERWAWDYLKSDELRTKLAPAAPPKEWEDAPPSRRLDAPGRPPELTVTPRSRKTPRGELRDPRLRASLLHTFLHHELQAAELMVWALLAFAGAPRAFRAGLLGVARDEIRHMGMYGDHLAKLGVEFGSLPVTDWFWERVPQTETPAAYVATMGMGFEAGNLDHAALFAERFRAAGDGEGALLQERVREEEVPHVRFAVHWFAVFTGGNGFQAWRAHLPRPLTPRVMRGEPVSEEARLRAGLSPAFIEELRRYDGREGA